jgi:hypothetical protein
MVLIKKGACTPSLELNKYIHKDVTTTNTKQTFYLTNQYFTNLPLNKKAPKKGALILFANNYFTYPASTVC